MDNHSFKGIYIDGGFTAIPRYVTRRRHPLSWSAQLVYLHLRDHCDVNRKCWPSIATLCFECGGIGRNTVVRAIRELESMNLVKRYHRHNHENKATMSNGYVVMDAPSKDSDVDATTLPDWEPLGIPDEDIPMTRTDTGPHPDEYTPSAPTVHEVEPLKDNHLKITNTPIAPKGGVSDTTPEDSEIDDQTNDQSTLFDAPTEPENKPKHRASTGYSDDFEAFWAVYPLKLDKRAAFKAFNRALKRVKLDIIMAGASSYASDPNLPEPRFIKHASTWLNGDGWDNPPLPSSKPVSGQHNKARDRLNDQVDMVRRIRAMEQQGNVGDGMELGR